MLKLNDNWNIALVSNYKTNISKEHDGKVLALNCLAN